MRRSQPLVRVVVFHDIQDDVWFEQMITHLVAQYHILTPDAYIQGMYVRGKINILITFDDGYASWVEKVFPLFKKHGIKGLFFINSGLVNLALDIEKSKHFVQEKLLLSSDRTILSWNGVHILHAQGHMIGGHTMNHVRLSTLPLREQRMEIGRDKEQIETMLGTSITCFAYPFGQRSDFTKATERAVFDEQYTHAFSTESSFVQDDVYAIPRLCIEDGLSVRQLSWWVEGGYDIYYTLKNLCVR